MAVEEQSATSERAADLAAHARDMAILRKVCIYTVVLFAQLCCVGMQRSCLPMHDNMYTMTTNTHMCVCVFQQVHADGLQAVVWARDDAQGVVASAEVAGLLFMGYVDQPTHFLCR